MVWQPRVDHGQKHDPGDEIIVQRDLTIKGPLQKHIRSLWRVSAVLNRLPLIQHMCDPTPYTVVQEMPRRGGVIEVGRPVIDSEFGGAFG
jgi:hypothetical protein